MTSAREPAASDAAEHDARTGRPPQKQKPGRISRALGPLLRPSGRAALTSAVLFALLGAFLFLNLPARGAARIWAFAAPFALALLWIRPDVDARGRAAAAVLGLLGLAVSWIDAAARGFIFDAYGSEPLSGFVVESVANTHPEEALEYLWTAAPEILPWALAAALGILVSAAAALRLAERAASAPDAADGASAAAEPKAPASPRSRLARIAALRLSQGWVFFLLLFSALVWSLRPWRALLPPIYWTDFLDSVEGFRAQWAQMTDERRDEAADALREILSSGANNRTIVLAIGESTVRDHLSLYGYERRTTPKLEAEAEADPRLVVVKNAWSVDANTLGAFRSMFELPGEGRRDPDNVFAYFRAAGWKIWWISNQDDTAIKGEFAAFADKALFLNPISGRSSLSLDGKVIEPLEEALADPAEKKLIVLHLIGAHPHYSLRYPPEYAPKWAEDDAVVRRLDALDRSSWLIDAVGEYDAAMTYQDAVLAETLDLSREASKTRSVDWIYLSDHGQELGRTENRTGHSRLTPSGYRIPLLLWSSDGRLKRDQLEDRPFRADRLSPLLLTLAGIDWRRESPENDFLSSRYDWREPKNLPEDPDLDAATAEEEKTDAAKAAAAP